VPRVYKFIIKYVTPLFLLIVLGAWFIQEGLPTIMMEKVGEADKAFVLGTRIGLVLLFATLAVLVRVAWKKRQRKREKELV